MKKKSKFILTKADKRKIKKTLSDPEFYKEMNKQLKEIDEYFRQWDRDQLELWLKRKDIPYTI